MKLIFRIIILTVFLMPGTIQGQEWKITDEEREFMIKLMKAEENTPDLMTLLPYDFSTEQTNLVAAFLKNNQHREALNEVLEHLNNGPLRLIPSDPFTSKHAIKKYYTNLFRPDSSAIDIYSVRDDAQFLATKYIAPQAIKDSLAWYPDILSNIDSIPANFHFGDTINLIKAYYQLANYPKVIKLYGKLSTKFQNWNRYQKYKIYALIHLKKFSEAEQFLTDYMSSNQGLHAEEGIIFNASTLLKHAGFVDKAQSMCHEYLQKLLTELNMTDAVFEKMGWFQLLPLYRYYHCAEGPDHPQTQKYWQKLNALEAKDRGFFLMTRMIKLGQSPQPLEKLANIDGPNPALTRAFYLSYLGFALDYQDLFYEELQIVKKALVELGPAPYFDHFK